MSVKNVVLLACGSYNPPTISHLRMFEIARDHLHKLGIEVLFGIVSPVHDGYGKKDLISSTHRLAMMRLSLQDSDWIKLSDWECRQESNSRTAIVLRHHQNLINAILNNKLNDNINECDLSWFPNTMRDVNRNMQNVQVKLLCGADLLESFETPGLWADEDIADIVGNHGLIVITRECCDPQKFIYMSDVLSKYMNNVIVVTEWMRNEISSTRVRRALRRHESIKYIVPEKVIEYIKKYELYGWTNTKKPGPSDLEEIKKWAVQ